MNYQTRITRLTILPQGEPIFSEQAISIEIEDEAAGEFLKISQNHDDPAFVGSVTVDEESWPAIRDAVDRMLAEIKTNETKP